MKLLYLLFLTIFLSSCEVYSRYFIISTNTSEEIQITVKVRSIYDLPKKNLPAYKNLVRCKAETKTEKKFNEKIEIKLDSIKMRYSFILPPCNTVWLQPTKIGIPALEYIVVNEKDSVALVQKNTKYNRNLNFKSLPNQKHVLILK